MACGEAKVSLVASTLARAGIHLGGTRLFMLHPVPSASRPGPIRCGEPSALRIGL